MTQEPFTHPPHPTWTETADGVWSLHDPEGYLLGTITRMGGGEHWAGLCTVTPPKTSAPDVFDTLDEAKAAVARAASGAVQPETELGRLVRRRREAEAFGRVVKRRGG